MNKTTNKNEKRTVKGKATHAAENKPRPIRFWLNDELVETKEQWNRVSARVWQAICNIYSEREDAIITLRLVDRETGELTAVVKTGSTPDEAIERAKKEKEALESENSDTKHETQPPKAIGSDRSSDE